MSFEERLAERKDGKLQIPESLEFWNSEYERHVPSRRMTCIYHQYSPFTMINDSLWTVLYGFELWNRAAQVLRVPTVVYRLVSESEEHLTHTCWRFWGIHELFSLEEFDQSGNYPNTSCQVQGVQESKERSRSSWGHSIHHIKIPLTRLSQNLSWVLW